MATADASPTQPEPTDRLDSVYVASSREGEFRQGEIISTVTQYEYNSETGEVLPIVHRYAIIASQDCDLLRQYDKPSEVESVLNGVLLFEAHAASSARKSVGNSSIWKLVKKNDHDRYHVLEAATAELDLQKEGTPDLVVDFRRMFTISPAELMRQCALDDGTKRRICLAAPYREHFQNRAMGYLARVGILLPHRVS